MRQLDYLFSPRSVALFGASTTPGKWGHRFTRLLIKGGYAGEIYPINPKGGEIDGRPIYPRLEDVGKRVDLAIILTPAKPAFEAVRSCAACAVKVAILFTAGFGEVDDSGKKHQEEMVYLAREAGMRLVGPNCMGVFNAAASLNLTGYEIPSGPIAIVSQSGNVGMSLWYDAACWQVGFSKFIGFGNQADIALHEYLDYLREDAHTGVVILYMEGLKKGLGPEFVRVARETTRVKPIVAIKGGRSEPGSRATASHTGSLAGKAELSSAVFRQAGIIEVDRLDELLPVAEVLMRCPPLETDNVALVGSGGGHAVLVADAVGREGLAAPQFDQTTSTKIASFLPYWAAGTNPVDMTGAFSADQSLWAKLTEVAFQDSQAMGGALVFGAYGEEDEWEDLGDWEKTAQQMVQLRRSSGKPIVLFTPYARLPRPCFAILREGGIPVFDSIELAGRGLRALRQYARVLARLAAPGKTWPSEEGVTSLTTTIFDKARARSRRNLTEPEAYQVLSLFGLPTVPHRLVTSEEEAVGAARAMGFPVVAKLVAPDVLHKSDVGGVVLGLNDEKAVVQAYRRLARCTPQVEGILVARQVTGEEVIVGMYRDPQFGPVLMVGLGGILVEVLKDVAFRVLPITEADAQEMLTELKGHSLLYGYRGRPAVCVQGLEHLLLGFARMALVLPDVAEVDLNPVLVTPEGAMVADSRIILEPRGGVDD